MGSVITTITSLACSKLRYSILYGGNDSGYDGWHFSNLVIECIV